MGSLQQTGIDYDAKFSSSCGIYSRTNDAGDCGQERLQGASNGLETDFLNGDLDVDVQLQISNGFQGMYGSGNVSYLRRSLYELKQAPRIWYEMLWADLIAKRVEDSSISF
jgi:Reverse transcriptase (RNA-dependent DNA polymerase)